MSWEGGTYDGWEGVGICGIGGLSAETALRKDGGVEVARSSGRDSESRAHHVYADGE